MRVVQWQELDRLSSILVLGSETVQGRTGVDLGLGLGPVLMLVHTIHVGRANQGALLWLMCC